MELSMYTLERKENMRYNTENRIDEDATGYLDSSIETCQEWYNGDGE